MEMVGKQPNQRHDPTWQRTFAVTRKPKPLLLARQILDPAYFRSMLDFCSIVAQACTRQTGFFMAVDQIEGALRYWADRASFQPEDQLEQWLFPWLDRFASEFTGWQRSHEATIEIFPPEDDDDSVE